MPLALVAAGGAAALLWASKPDPRITPLNLPSLTGGRIHIPDPRGRLSWVSSWSASCAPCLHELPALEAFHRRYGDQLSIVALAMPYDPPNIILDVQTRLRLSVPVALDLEGSAARRLTPDLVVPSHHLIDSQGRILLNLRGALTLDEMLAQLRPYLQTQADTGP
ncbi:TlpA disulfide reductase family protein [Candidatus Thiothrix sp. Deng01]|uniref:TlpA disulfide reductase family protein n=1 Tax=Candidatus Thiothrix phosphatis TaxID=3112415 RepID=A0ABU6CXC2_9GAMM|nr:TlpA disulfide reductase family protein [Candidatus Thiothrix sp. Deng01]MEB4591477.1 TlpA disulfide reductase family protein [Candidatus Thiothrix sp. Deng01]